MSEGFLHLQSLLASDASMDDDHGFLATEKRRDALFEIIQRIAMLGKDDQLLVRRGSGRWYCAIASRNRELRDPIRDSGSSEDGREQASQLPPLGIRPAATDRLSMAF